MKRHNYILLLLSILYCAQNIDAQFINNCLVDSNIWAVVADNMDYTGVDTDISYCYIWGTDSIINGSTYKTVYCAHKHPGIFFEMLENKTYDEILCYREEDKKIFRFDNNIGKEVKLYDFGLKVDDETTILDGKRIKVMEEYNSSKLNNFCYPIPHIEQCQDYVPPKAWRVIGIDDETYEDIWIDGAGSLYTGLLIRSDFPEDKSLASVFNPTSGFLRYTQHDMIQPVWMNSIDFGNMEREEYVITYFDNDTLVISGITRFYPSPFHLFMCHITGNEIFISAVPTNPLSTLADSLITSKFEVRFPGFGAGIYNVKQEIGLEGYSETWGQQITLTCHGPATSIDNITDEKKQVQPNAIYDLSGRWLTSPPERGIYIENGRKKVR